MTLVSSLLVAGLLAPVPDMAERGIPGSEPSSEQTTQVGTRSTFDQTVPVVRGTRIDMNGMSGCNGLVTVNTWNRDAVRVQATHGARTAVRVTPRDQVLLIRTEARGPMPVDFELTVPVWIAISANGPFCHADVDGLAGTVVVETVEGDIVFRNLTGSATAKAIEGNVIVEGGRGRTQVVTVEGNIDLVKVGGEVVVETTEGTIGLRGMQATTVEASSVEGDITFEGEFVGSGRYLFTSHEGHILLSIPETSDATLGVRTFRGGKVDSSIRLKTISSTLRGRRSVFTLGSGSAQVEVESFEGNIRIRRPGER